MLVGLRIRHFNNIVRTNTTNQCAYTLIKMLFIILCTALLFNYIYLVSIGISNLSYFNYKQLFLVLLTALINLPLSNIVYTIGCAFLFKRQI